MKTIEQMTAEYLAQTPFQDVDPQIMMGMRISLIAFGAVVRDAVLDTIRATCITCIVNGCTNRSDQGNFVDSMCVPCHNFITKGRGVHSQAFRNAMLASARVVTKVGNLDHVAGGLQDDGKEYFPSWGT